MMDQMQYILECRKNILETYALTVVREFDTRIKENGAKDVTECLRRDGQRVILRIGEARPSTFFPDGFIGRTIRIPKVYERGMMPMLFEIEERIDGQMYADRAVEGVEEGKIRPEILRELLAAFWEFQEIGKSVNLEHIDVTEKIEKHFLRARELILEADRVQKCMHDHADFWRGAYPSKWKFALDNLLWTIDGKVAFIDSARVGLRYVGYDLGWIIWPRWLQMETDQYKDVEAQMRYLEDVLRIVMKTRPVHLPFEGNLEQSFWLMILERAIGALFDVANETKHLVGANLGSGAEARRRDAHVFFLNRICSASMDRIEM